MKGILNFRTLPTGLVVLVLAAAGVVYLADSDKGLPSPQGSTLAEPPVLDTAGHEVTLNATVVPEIGAGRVDVFLDGWSHRIVDDARVRVRRDDEDPRPTTFEPVSPADVAELLATSPGLIADTLSRQVSGTGDLTCDQAGCTIDGKTVDPVELITDPSTVPGYGAVYDDWGVESLLHRATIATTGNQHVELEVEGYGSWTTFVVPETGSGSEADRWNGHLTNRHLLGAAFGRLFPLTPTWRDGGEFEPARYYPQSFEDPDPNTTLGLRTTMHLGGLGEPWKDTAHLSTSALTYLSSVTAGCDVGVMCTPDPVDISLAGASHTQVPVCATDAAGRALRGWAVFDSVVVTANFKNATHQLGLWGSVSVDQVAKGDGSGLLRGAVMPPVQGKASFRWKSVGIYDSSEGQLRAVAGAYGPDTETGGSVEELLAEVNVDYFDWAPCA